MALTKTRSMLPLALALCPVALAAQNPTTLVDQQFSQTFFAGSDSAVVDEVAAGSFLVDGMAHPGCLALANPDPLTGSVKFVYHMDQVARWNAIYKVADIPALDLSVLRAQGPAGLDVALILTAAGLQAYVANADHDGFVATAGLPTWEGVNQIWVCADHAGNDTVFGHDPLLGILKRATYDHSTTSFTEGPVFGSPLGVEDLVALDFDTGNGGQELALLASSGTLTVHTWEGTATLAALVPHGSATNPGAISVIRGEGDEQEADVAVPRELHQGLRTVLQRRRF